MTEHGPNTGFHQAPDRAVRMAGGRVVVAPIENGRRAQINLVQRADKIGEICIVCRVARCDTRMHFVEIFGDRPVTGDAADAGLPSMNMSINETGHHNLAGGVDDFRVGRPERFSDFLDFVPVDQNIAFLKIAHSAVHGNYRSVLDKRLGHTIASPCSPGACAGGYAVGIHAMFRDNVGNYNEMCKRLHI